MHPGYDASFHYTIVREKSFDAKMQDLISDFTRLAEFEHALDWALARQPHAFTQYFSDVYFLITEDLGEYGMPSLRILYKIDPDKKEVLLIDVDLKE